MSSQIFLNRALNRNDLHTSKYESAARKFLDFHDLVTPGRSRASIVDGDGGPSQVYVFCTPTAVRTASCVSSALEHDIAPETVVFSRRSLKTLLEHPPTRTIFYMQCRLRKVD